RRRSLVTTGSEHHAVQGIAEKHFHETQVSEIAVERRGRPLARFLDGMHGKFEGNATRIADPFAHPFGQFQMMPIARRKVRAALRYPDDRLSRREFSFRQAEI